MANQSDDGAEGERSNRRQDADVPSKDSASDGGAPRSRGGRGGRPERSEADRSQGEGYGERRHSLKRRYDEARREGRAEGLSDSRGDGPRPANRRDGGGGPRRRGDGGDRPRRRGGSELRRGPSRPGSNRPGSDRRGVDRPRGDRRDDGRSRPRREDGRRGTFPGARRDEGRRFDGAGPPSPRPPSTRPPAAPLTPASKRQPAGQRLADIDTLEVKVEKLISGGDGIARFEGIPIFIPRSAPGDHLRVRIVERKPSFGRAEILEILKPGRGRRDAPCPHYEACGGCQLQHLDEAEQLKGKAQAARDNLERLGGLSMPSDIRVVAGEPWGYRMRAQWQVADTPRGREVGYYARGSHDLVAVQECPVLVPALAKRLADVQAAADDVTHRRLDVCIGEKDAWAVSPAAAGLPSRAVRMQVGDFLYQYDAGCFFQAHHQLVDRLVTEALGAESENAEGDEEHQSGETVAYDLYSGVGLFSLPLARRYSKVVAVEGGREAARYGRRNVQLNRMDNVEVVNQAVDTWVAELPEDAARVLVDPPRVGLSGPVRQALLDRPPRSLTYVSCDSATLARDLKYLKSSFRVVSLALLDMFPQTGHLEAVVQLERS